MTTLRQVLIVLTVLGILKIFYTSESIKSALLLSALTIFNTAFVFIVMNKFDELNNKRKGNKP